MYNWLFIKFRCLECSLDIGVIINNLHNLQIEYHVEFGITWNQQLSLKIHQLFSGVPVSHLLLYFFEPEDPPTSISQTGINIHLLYTVPVVVI